MNEYVSPPEPDPALEAILERGGLPLNDQGNAERLRGHFGDRFRHVSGRGWAVWDGRRYSFENGYGQVVEASAALTDLLIEESDAGTDLNWSRLSSKCAHDHRRFAINSGNIPRRKNALKALENMLALPFSAMDSAPELLQLGNGTLDLDRFAKTTRFPRQRKRSAEGMAPWASAFFGPHQRAHHPSKSSPVAFRPEAPCPKWREFLRLIQPDPDIRKCLQTCLGAALFGANESQMMLMFRGSGGNGKSTLLDTLRKVLAAMPPPALPNSSCAGRKASSAARRPKRSPCPPHAWSLRPSPASATRCPAKR